jgi:hypothetical protein
MSVETVLKYIELGQDYKCFTRVSRFLVNRWRFRDGYYNEQHDDEGNRNERTSRDTLTARELLSYIAHRDPETNRYFFGEDEHSALEDVLGQVGSYLCAALRPSPDKERATEPLPMTVLQEV